MAINFDYLFVIYVKWITEISDPFNISLSVRKLIEHNQTAVNSDYEYIKKHII